MKDSNYIYSLAIALALVIAGCGGSGGDAPAPAPDTTPPVTTASPAGGLYDTPQQVTLTANEAATIYYSTDGNDPAAGAGNTTSGASPVAGIPMPSGTTELRFYAIDLASNNETVKSETYEIDDIAPNVSITSGAPPPIGLLAQTTMTWQSDEDGNYAVEIGGNGTQGSGTQIAAGAALAGTPVDQAVLGRQLSYLAPTEIWVYVTDAVGNTGADNELFTLKPVVTVPGVAPGGSITPPLLVNNAGTRLYARDNGIQVIDIESSSGTYNTVVASVTVGNSTRGFAITPDDSRLYVADEQSSSIAVINTVTNTVSTTLNLAGLELPIGIAITPDGTRLYASHWGVWLNVLDVDPGSGLYHTIIDNIIIDGLLLWGEIAITPNGKLAVVNWVGMIATAVDIVDVDPASPSYNIPVARPVPVLNGGGTAVIVTSDSKFAYVSIGTTNGLKKIDLGDFSVPVQVAHNITGFALSGDDQLLLAGKPGVEELYIFSADTLAVLAAVPVGGAIYALELTPDGNYAYAGRYQGSTATYDLIMLALH